MSNGKIQLGQQYRSDYNILIPYEEQMLDRKNANAVQGTATEEITPNDSDSALTRQYDLADINTAFASVIVAYEMLISLDLPDVLSSVTAIYNSTSSDGSSTQTGEGGSEGSYASLSLSLHGTGQAGGSIQPDIEYQISITPKDNIQGKVRVFFVQSPSTISDILTTLSGPTFFNETVTLIPLWKKQVVTVSLRGQQAAYSATADVQQRVEISQANVTETDGKGEGTSASFGTTTKSVQLPATITPGFTIAGTSTATVSCSASATISGGTNWPAQSSTAGGGGTLTATISPDIPATAQTAIPTSGLYLVKLDVTPFSGYGNNMVRAVVVDFAQFA